MFVLQNSYAMLFNVQIPDYVERFSCIPVHPRCHSLVFPTCEIFEHLLSSLGLSQVISEPTNFEPNKNLSCIDLVITDQPNLILDCGTRSSLDPFCHHDIVYCKVNFTIPPPPPLDRKIWHFNRANSAAIKRSMHRFPWLQQLNLNTDAN